MGKTFLALDLGGTKLLLGEVTEKGEILNHKSYTTGHIDQQQASAIIIDAIEDYISSVGWATPTPPTAIGVGLVGRVDNANGIWFQMDTQRTSQVMLARDLSEKYYLPCYIDNDVKSAARAENIFGYGRESKDFIYINIGTGIAAAMIINGNLVRGSHYNAGEVGHTNVGVTVNPECDCKCDCCDECKCGDVKCVCGRSNCVELFASGSGIKRLLAECRAVGECPADDAKSLFKLAQAGDTNAHKLVDQIADAIASLIMNLVRVSDPDTIILGGGVVADGYIFEKVKEKLNPKTIRFVSNGVVLTKLDPDFIGLIGAAAVAMNK